MKYEVFLRRYVDHDSGMNGLMAPETAESFDPFWEPSGIFHDVFEHWFEDKHKYFKNSNALTLYGEMVATGHRIFIHNYTGFEIFKYRKFRQGWTDYTVDTINECFEIMGEDDDYARYPASKLPIPGQKLIGGYNEVESTIEDYWYKLREKYSSAQLQSKGIYKSRIADAYRYGYRMAERMWGKFDRNNLYEFFDSFLDQWNRITKSEVSELYIPDEDAYPILGFKFKLSNEGKKPMVKTKIVDEAWREYDMSLLENF